MKQNMSMKDIAELSGVSVATVSRVMNGLGGYSAETEQRVKDIIEKYQYIPNLVAKGLRTSRSPIVGIIVPDIVNEYFAKLVLDLQVELFHYGYLTMVCNVNESSELEEEHIRALAAQNVSGIILISGTDGNMELQNIPTVYIDRRPKEGTARRGIVMVESDNVQGGYLAADEMIQAGCRRIAFVTDMMGESSKIGRYEGFCKALSDAGLSVNPGLVMRVRKVSIEHAYDVITQNMEMGLDFDSVVCTTDLIAIGAVLAVKALGKRVPEDIKVSGFDDISTASIFSPSLTTVHQYGERMAKVVSELLIKLIRKEKIVNHHHVIPVELVRRESTRI